jgi:integrase
MAFGRKPRMRLFDFLPIYIERYLKVKDARSLQTELGRIRKIKEHFGNMPVDEIDTLAIEEYLSGLSSKGRKPATVNRYHARISSMMRRAMVWGYRDDNPAERIERLKELKLGDRYLEPEEFHQLIEACHPEIRPLVLVAANTGMRRGELLNLKWEDINWKGRYLVMSAQNSKTAEGRIVPLN